MDTQSDAIEFLKSINHTLIGEIQRLDDEVTSLKRALASRREVDQIRKDLDDLNEAFRLITNDPSGALLQRAALNQLSGKQVNLSRI